MYEVGLRLSCRCPRGLPLRWDRPRSVFRAAKEFQGGRDEEPTMC